MSVIAALVALILCWVCVLPVAAEQVNRAEMEVGALLGGQFAADYRGSEYYSARFLPLPYLFYQSPIFKVDRNGVRGEFWRSQSWQLNISLDGSIGGSDADNPYRQGMDELDSAVEFGPSLDVLLGGDSFEDGWLLRIPVRGVLAVGKQGIEPIGFVFNPRLAWRKPDLHNNWRLSFHFGILFADQKYHDYFYAVKPAEALSWRPEYHSESGYSGSFVRLNFYQQWQDWRWGISLRYDYLAGAKFMDSPLVETEHYGSVAFVVMRRFWSYTFD